MKNRPGRDGAEAKARGRGGGRLRTSIASRGERLLLGDDDALGQQPKTYPRTGEPSGMRRIRKKQKTNNTKKKRRGEGFFVGGRGSGFAEKNHAPRGS